MIGKALLWKLLERFGVLGIQFVLQIILARLLDPDLYGVLSIMVIFTTLANVFIQTGFNTALIQNKDVTEEDYSSAFWVTELIAGVLYVVLFAVAPWIAKFYNMPSLVAPFRVLCLMLLPGAYNSIQIAKVSREMDFCKLFFSNILGIIVAGVVGIVIAYMGGGLWALVAQTLLNVTMAALIMAFTVKWRPRFVINMGRIRVLFGYGSKLLASGLLDTFYQNLQGLVIGKKYDSSTLAYYDRGKQFPMYGISAINSAVQSVLLPAMATDQNNTEKIKKMTRTSVMLSCYILFPAMAGLAAVTPAFVELVLTDKWLPCVPYMQICCITFAFYPIHTTHLQAIKAMGRSDIFLKLEIIKKTIGITSLTIAVVCFDNPMAIAMADVIILPLGILINAAPNKKLLNYRYRELMQDILPALLASVAMFVVVERIGTMDLNCALLLAVQVFIGIGMYLILSIVMKLTPLRIIVEMLKRHK